MGNVIVRQAGVELIALSDNVPRTITVRTVRKLASAKLKTPSYVIRMMESVTASLVGVAALVIDLVRSSSLENLVRSNATVRTMRNARHLMAPASVLQVSCCQ